MIFARPSFKTAIVLCTGVCLLSSCRSQNGDDASNQDPKFYPTVRPIPWPEPELEPQTPAEDDSSTQAEPDFSSTLETPKARAPVVLRRLNRAEYARSIEALFGQDFGLYKDFPSEDPSLGFDNIGEALSLSPLQMELYERAAQKIVERLVSPSAPESISMHWEAEVLEASTGSICCEGFWKLNHEGSLDALLIIEQAGSYSVDIRTYAEQMGEEAAKLRFEVDHEMIGEWEVKAVQEAPEILKLQVALTRGEHRLRILFTNDAEDPEKGTDRNLLIDWLHLKGPIDAPPIPNPKLSGLLDCNGMDEQKCYEDWVDNFGLRAWRRPLNLKESATLKGLYKGRAIYDAVSRALSAFLLSPHFLFRVEIDPDPDCLSTRELNGYELATRLSYFLWSRPPDARLFELADEGKLKEDRVLSAEVERMLNDRKAEALVHNFAGQWLSIRELGGVFKDPHTFPGFTSSLLEAMRKEQELFFWSFLREDRPIEELLTSQHSYVNKELAEFYGLKSTDVPVHEHVPVSLESSARRGLLGQGGLMAVLAHPNGTSPVVRGKWVLEHLLCIQPPPPPPSADTSPVEPSETQTMREQLAKHSEDPKCAGCHQLMDPIGLALENFDGMGRWRDQENGRLIDARGSLPSGMKLSGPQELSEAIARDPGFIRCSVRKALIYALGRDLTSDDRRDVDLLVNRVQAAGSSFRVLLREVVMSPIFRRRG